MSQAGDTKAHLRHTIAGARGAEIAISMSRVSLPSAPHERQYKVVVMRRVASARPRRRIESDVVSAASHELLSPLNLIRGYTSTLLEFGESLSPEQKERYLRGIEATTSKAVQTVKNFLDVTRLEAKGLDLGIEPTFLPELLRKAVTEMQHQTTTHVIKLRQPRTLPTAHIDRSRIEQVVANLLANAVKYSPQGNNIEVTVILARRGEDLAAIVGEGPGVETPCLIVSVKDRGMGIPADELDRVFDKFHRVDSRLTKVTSGIGLGLYICRVIIEAHGGRIWASSQLGKGSTFSFSLPLLKAASANQG
jgi:signal transduction histidine kinase